MTLTEAAERPDAPSPSDVRVALDRVLASEAFRASPQLGAFLRYVVDVTLAGRGASLKGYTIGVEALGRDPRFNPQVDPIVRVEATRLRRALERYYAGDGRNDPVAIGLPRGGYVPTFTAQIAAEAARAATQAATQAASQAAARGPAAPPPAAAAARAPAPALLALVLFAALMALAGLVLLRQHGASVNAPHMTTGSVATNAMNRLPAGNGMPTIYIEPLRVVGTPAPGHVAAAALADKMRDAFARFDTVNVAADPRAAHIAYRLAGSIDYGASATTLRFALIDAAEQQIVWSRSFDYPAAAAEQNAAEDATVVALTNALLQSYGVIRARDRARQLAGPGGDPRYRCVLAAADSFRFLDPALHEAARACLEQLTAADPSFAVGFEFLAIVYYREDAIGYPPHPGDAPALDRALRAARHAVELAPASGRAYQDLFVVLYARHDVDAAFAAGAKAMELNRYDLLTVAEYGGRLIMTGEVERGLAMVRRAADNRGTVLPSWQHFYLFLGNYLAGDLKQATFNAEQITDDNYPLGLVARAIAANRAGNADEARRLIDRLIAIQPAWRTDARGLLAKSIYRPESVERLLHDLAAVGLPGDS